MLITIKARALLAELKQRARYPRTRWYVKLLVAAIVAYAFSPIDLIPDFVPVLAYLNDLILIPMGIALTIKLIPHSVLAECRKHMHRKPYGLKNRDPGCRRGNCTRSYT